MNPENAFDSFPQLETEYLILREIRIEDKNDIFSIFSDEETLEYYDLNPFKRISEVENLINHFKDSFSNQTSIRWGIELKDSNKIIGTCGFHSWNKESSRVQIGYELKKEYCRQGIMTKALKVMLDYGFNSLKLNRIEALVEPENISSKHLLNKLHFVEEGELREYVFCRDKYVNIKMFSILYKDYTK